MTDDQSHAPYDGSLTGSHSYLGLTDEHALNFPEFTLLSNGTKIECPLLASKFCLYPGEILPIITDDGDAINVLEQVRSSQNGYCFHLAHESNEDTNRYGVLLQLTHYRTDEIYFIAKLKALQIFIFPNQLRLSHYGIEVFLFNLKVTGEAVKEGISHLILNASDPNWIYQKSQTFEVPRNMLRFLTNHNWDTIKAKIFRYYLLLGMDENFAKNKLEEDPAFVSYYLISNIPMTLKEKEDLFFESVESRIIYCLDNLVARFISITCNRHNCLLAKNGDFIFVSHAGICQLFVNPAGFYFNVVTVKSDHLALGTSENTWYPNYNWGYLLCECSKHHGWGYSSFTSKPNMFACIHFKSCIINRLPIMRISEYPSSETRELREKDWHVRYDGY
uniref:Uncharacterized protein n=1 Tax=Panagrolaimus superbus TaxID=310955 RepID=A0A914YCT1_9BILA